MRIWNSCPEHLTNHTQLPLSSLIAHSPLLGYVCAVEQCRECLLDLRWLLLILSLSSFNDKPSLLSSNSAMRLAAYAGVCIALVHSLE